MLAIKIPKGVDKEVRLRFNQTYPGIKVLIHLRGIFMEKTDLKFAATNKLDDVTGRKKIFIKHS